MKCKQADRYLLRVFDGKSSQTDKQDIENHLISCSSCRKKEREYRLIFETLRGAPTPDIKPYFWQRLQPRLRERKKFEPWFVWKRWSLRAVPLSLLTVAIVTSLIWVFVPRRSPELSQTEVLLLRNLNPLQENQAILEQDSAENQGMMLIFTSLDEQGGKRSYFP